MANLWTFQSLFTRRSEKSENFRILEPSQENLKAFFSLSTEIWKTLVGIIHVHTFPNVLYHSDPVQMPPVLSPRWLQLKLWGLKKHGLKSWQTDSENCDTVHFKVNFIEPWNSSAHLSTKIVHIWGFKIQNELSGWKFSLIYTSFAGG